MPIKRFTRQQESARFLDSIPDDTSRLLTRFAVSRALREIGRNPDIASDAFDFEFDTLVFARVLSVFFENTGLLRKVLSGEVTDVSQLDPFTTSNPV